MTLGDFLGEVGICSAVTFIALVIRGYNSSD